ncbi:MliC family protein [Parahaliea mediterranea]|uniref:MliC family protein n=1 Tax=Parahaliea mediterranea TaxID=651086 RepID=UPI000E2E6050|nr:MliC family protein [Parahaliea mediterranea]
MNARWLCFVPALSLLVACGAGNTRSSDPEPDPTDLSGIELSPDDAFVYQCNGGAFTAQFGPERMDVWLNGKHYRLAQQRSGSGVRYGEGDVLFVGKGRDGSLEIGDVIYRNCHTDTDAKPLSGGGQW